MTVRTGGRSFTYPPAPGTRRIERLFSVAITHSYYTQQDGRCTDFQIAPTPTTSSLMASLGLLLKNERAGFSIFYDPDQLHKLVTYLRQHAEDPEGQDGFWSRLTFLLILVNPSFVGITALPIETKLTQVNLYGANLQAHRRKGAPAAPAVLPPGRFMSGGALYPVVGSDVSLTLPHETSAVTVSDISGAVVLPPPGGDPIPIFDTGSSPTCLKYASVDMSSLPYGLYTFALEDGADQPIETGVYPHTALYVPSDAGTMVLLDMLFTQPTPESGGIYPIPPLFDGAPDPALCGNLAYQLPFDARRTYWRYYVVSEVPGGRLSDLAITGPGAAFVQDPDPVPLPNGSAAILFRSDTVLPLRQQSGQHFRLTGQRQDPLGQDSAIAVARLPVAPAAPVWPGPASEGRRGQSKGMSEMFVYV